MAEEMFPCSEQKKWGKLCSADGKTRVECEIVLPEYKEEAERILRVIPKAVIKSKSCTVRGQLLVCELEGSVGFHVLYRTSSEKSRVSAFLHSENFALTLKAPITAPTPEPEEIFLFAEATPDALSAKLSGPRKISARCDLELMAQAWCNLSFSHLSQSLPSDLILKKRECHFARLRTVHTEQMNFSQTISLPKAYLPIEEICEMDVALFAKNVTAEDGGIGFSGLCDLSCSYAAQGEELFISFYQPIEFDRRVGIAEVKKGDFCRVQLTPVSLKVVPDVNEEGENKNVVFQLVFDCETLVFENEVVELIEDVFSTKSHLKALSAQEQGEELLGVYDVSATVKGEIPDAGAGVFRAEGISSTVHFTGSYWEDGKIALEGKLRLSYLAIDQDGGEKVCMENFDFQTKLAVGEGKISDSQECRVEICGGVCGVELEPEKEALRLRFDLCGNITVFATHRILHVSSLERGDFIPKRKGEILYVYPTGEEDLWALSKAYHVSPEKLQAENHLSGELLLPCMKILP